MEALFNYFRNDFHHIRRNPIKSPQKGQTGNIKVEKLIHLFVVPPHDDNLCVGRLCFIAHYDVTEIAFGPAT